MNGPRDYHTNWSKLEKGRQTPYDITYMWNLKYDTNELIYKTETDLENKVMVTKGEKGREGINWEIGTDIYTLLYIK